MMTGFQKQAKIPTSLSPLLHPTDLANPSSTTAEQPVPMSTVPNQAMKNKADIRYCCDSACH